MVRQASRAARQGNLQASPGLTREENELCAACVLSAELAGDAKSSAAVELAEAAGIPPRLTAQCTRMSHLLPLSKVYCP